jgi:hypothetical protein
MAPSYRKRPVDVAFYLADDAVVNDTIDLFLEKHG